MLRTFFLLSVCVWCGSHGLPRSVRSDNFAWLLGPQGSGDCDRICSDQSAKCSDGMGQRAAADNRILKLTSWYHHGCKGYNAWDYGQGFSECTDPACCVDGSCQNHCSITSSWPGCGDIGNFNGHHSRICPCEFLAPPPPPPPTCPEGWFYFKGKCYGHPKDKKLSWTDANSYCQNWSLGAHLASIHSVQEKEFVQTKFPRNIWLGGNDRAKEGRWVWSDGTPWDYSAWDNQQPDNLRGQHCLLGNWNNLKWDDASCPLELLFLCMKQL